MQAVLVWHVQISDMIVNVLDLADISDEASRSTASSRAAMLQDTLHCEDCNLAVEKDQFVGRGFLKKIWPRGICNSKLVFFKPCLINHYPSSPFCSLSAPACFHGASLQEHVKANSPTNICTE